MTVCDACKMPKPAGMGYNTHVEYQHNGASFCSRAELCDDCRRLLGELLADPGKLWSVLRNNCNGAHPAKVPR